MQRHLVEDLDTPRSVPSHPSDVVPQRLLNRVVHYADGTRQWERTVFCPHKHERISAEECHACADFCSFLTDKVPGALDYIRCRADPFEGPSATGGGALEDPLDGSVINLIAREVICVLPDCLLPQLRDLMAEQHVGGIIVINRRRHPIGIVTRSDLLDDRISQAALHHPEPVGTRTEGGYTHEFEPTEAERQLRISVRELMTPLVEALPSSATIGQAAAVMAESGIDRIPVTDDDGELIGLVVAQDILRWIAHSAGHHIAALHQ